MKGVGSGLNRYSNVLEEAREVQGGFLGCDSSEVAMCDSTTTGMNIFLWGYNWEKGDEIIAGGYENNAAMVPLAVLAQRRGVRVRYVDISGSFSENLSEEISKDTKMVLISDVNYVTGSRVNLQEVSDIAHDAGALVIADGIQAVGTVPVDVKKLGVDGYAMARHKFMCGPDGAGGLYVNRDVFDEIHPTFSGVFTDTAHGSGELRSVDSAQRYEVSTRALPVIQGGSAAVKWLTEEVGLEYIFEKSEKLYHKLWKGLKEISGVEVISGEKQSSLLSFRVKNKESSEVSKKLRDWNIFTRTVGILEPAPVRISVGFWNRESDVDKIVEAVGEIAKS
jgi:L-cysteine/cystine lyase